MPDLMPEPADSPWFRFFCAIRLLAAEIDAQQAKPAAAVCRLRVRCRLHFDGEADGGAET